MASKEPQGKYRPLGWYSRGYHPHLDERGLVQSVGFRLADSVPQHLLRRWRAEQEQEEGVEDNVKAVRLARSISRFEDAG